MANMKTDEPKKKTVRRVKKSVRAREKHEAFVRKPNRRTPEEKAALREKQANALELRLAGTSYDDIAAALGYHDASGARKAVNSAISRVQIDAAKEVVAMDLARLDEFQMRCTHALRTNGDLHQIDRILRLMEWRYRLLGVTDETVRALQSEHGIHTVNNIKNNVMVVQAAPETEKEFIEKMMKSVGVNPESEEAQALMRQYHINEGDHELPMLEGSANAAEEFSNEQLLEGEDIVDAEIVD